MQGIQLPDKECLLLREMIEKLFMGDRPEDLIIYEDPKFPTGGSGTIISMYQDDGTDRMHWFEFLLTQLIPRIAYKLGIEPKEIALDLWNECNFSHPVITVYERFKRVKLQHEMFK